MEQLKISGECLYRWSSENSGECMYQWSSEDFWTKPVSVEQWRSLENACYLWSSEDFWRISVSVEKWRTLENACVSRAVKISGEYLYQSRSEDLWRMPVSAEQWRALENACVSRAVKISGEYLYQRSSEDLWRMPVSVEETEVKISRGNVLMENVENILWNRKAAQSHRHGSLNVPKGTRTLHMLRHQLGSCLCSQGPIFARVLNSCGPTVSGSCIPEAPCFLRSSGSDFSATC